jgi:hypothetical protein
MAERSPAAADAAPSSVTSGGAVESSEGVAFRGGPVSTPAGLAAAPAARAAAAAGSAEEGAVPLAGGSVEAEGEAEGEVEGLREPGPKGTPKLRDEPPPPAPTGPPPAAGALPSAAGFRPLFDAQEGSCLPPLADGLLLPPPRGVALTKPADADGLPLRETEPADAAEDGGAGLEGPDAGPAGFSDPGPNGGLLPADGLVAAPPAALAGGPCPCCCCRARLSAHVRGFLGLPSASTPAVAVVPAAPAAAAGFGDAGTAAPVPTPPRAAAEAAAEGDAAPPGTA